MKKTRGIWSEGRRDAREPDFIRFFFLFLFLFFFFWGGAGGRGEGFFIKELLLLYY